jgi:polysaccharide deacetylase family protein (PEP-CTERM system associated)
MGKIQSSLISLLVISVDIEDWPQSTWDHSLDITVRAAHNTELVLDILAQHGKTVTMFVLGKFAEQFPKIVKRIAREGHEVASHGYGHIEIFHQTAAEFREDVRRSKQFLEDLSGQPIIGYRAPDFTITSSTIWALEVLADLGFEYDSSIFPITNKRYGIEAWPPNPVRVYLPSQRSIIELPIATMRIFNRSLPIAGGGYHRLLPWCLINWAIHTKIGQGDVFVAYYHPYEFDPNEFNSTNLSIPLRTRLHQGIGRRGLLSKFEKILNHFATEKACIVAGLNWPEYRL